MQGRVGRDRPRARAITPPPLDDAARIREGFEHYDEMCEICHGAPGHDPSELSKGLNPPAPDLHDKEETKEWTAADMFWITKNGIKMTAMPGWGPTHDDEKIWAIVAFLRKLPELGAAEYAQMKKSVGNDDREQEGESEHEHRRSRETATRGPRRR